MITVPTSYLEARSALLSRTYYYFGKRQVSEKTEETTFCGANVTKEELMYCRALKIVVVSLLIASANSATAQENGLPQPVPSLAPSNRSDAWQIENALSAGPKYITDHATVMIWPSADKEHTMRVLRDGSNGWVCMPEGDGLVDHGDHLAFDHEKPRHNPMCADPTMMKWMMAMMDGKKPTIDRIGISYMLQGEGGGDVRFAGPHIMLVLPDGGKDALKDVGKYTSSGGAAPYVYGPGAPSPLLIIPVAKPDEVIVTKKAAASN
jgi:hypothetical protein